MPCLEAHAEPLRRAVCVGFSVITTLLLHGQPAWAAEGAGVQWVQGRLSVQAGTQPLAEVLNSIRSLTGIELRSEGALGEPVTRGFEALPLVDALKRLLADHNHMIVQRGPRQALLVVVLGGFGSGSGSGVAPSSAALSRPAATAVTVQQAAQQASQQRAQQAARQALEQTALSDADAAARIEAVERLAEMADKGDGRSLAALRHALNDPSDAVRAVAQQAVAAHEKLPMARAIKPPKPPG